MLYAGTEQSYWDQNYRIFLWINTTTVCGRVLKFWGARVHTWATIAVWTKDQLTRFFHLLGQGEILSSLVIFIKFLKNDEGAIKIPLLYLNCRRWRERLKWRRGWGSGYWLKRWRTRLKRRGTRQKRWGTCAKRLALGCRCNSTTKGILEWMLVSKRIQISKKL